MKLPRWRFGVAARLAVLLGSVATASTLIALLIQDRALSSDLQDAAQQRLESAARAADRLIADYLLGVADRYAAISRTPEFRANLAADHLPTLTYYARQLADGQGASALAFLRRSGAIAARVGDAELANVAAQRVARDTSISDNSCIRSGGEKPGDRRFSAGNGVHFEPCEFPDVGAEASLLWADGELYALVAIPLRTSGVLEGGLVALEAVGSETLRTWSERFGAGSIRSLRRGIPLSADRSDPRYSPV